MQVLRQSTQIIVRVGPFVDVTDGFTPETGITLGAADEAEALKANGAATVDISGATWAAITGADGWYNLTLTTSLTDTVGCLDIVVHDDSVCLPVFARFQVIEEAAYDAIYAASAAPATAAGVSAVETDTQDIQGRLPAALVSGRIDASAGALAANVITATSIAADAITAAKIADGAIDAGSIAAAALNGKGDWNVGKTGYALSAAGVQAIWDALTTALTTVGSIGKKLADWTIGTAQTGDAFARLGAPAGASVSADIAAVKTQTAAIETDTAEIGAAGAGLTALATQASVNTIDDFLDTEIAAILAAVDTEVAAIKAKTDSLTFTVPGVVDANVENVNDVTIVGDGSGTPFGV